MPADSIDIESAGKIYRETLLQTKKSLMEIIQNDLKLKGELDTFTSILEQATEKIIQNWLSGKKYIRTLFMHRVMEDHYPQKAIQLSLSIDAIINILDDILDEDLDNQTKTAYIVEFIRTMAIFTSKISDPYRAKMIERYFNKIISIAIGEKIYKNLIKNETGAEKTKRLLLEVYTCRSLDMDIFVELPLLEIQFKSKDVDKMLILGRHFRILNLIKKDIDDIEHDKRGGIDTGVTLAFEKENPKELIKSVADKIVADSKQTSLGSEECFADKFKKMIEEERHEIEDRLKSVKL